MKDLVLNAQTRSGEEKLSEVRASKMVPGVVYVALNIDGKKIEVLVHEYQKNPVT